MINIKKFINIHNLNNIYDDINLTFAHFLKSVYGYQYHLIIMEYNYDLYLLIDDGYYDYIFVWNHNIEFFIEMVKHFGFGNLANYGIRRPINFSLEEEDKFVTAILDNILKFNIKKMFTIKYNLR